jgi:virginiamycin A acetyltransferase
MTDKDCGPPAHARLPIPGVARTVFLKSIVTNPANIFGDYSYYDDHDDPTGFERNVLYHFDFIGDRLIIGRFCQIASGVRFIMNGGNHRASGSRPIRSPCSGRAGPTVSTASSIFPAVVTW